MTVSNGQAPAGAHIPALVPLRETAKLPPNASTLRAIRRAGITGTFVTAKSDDKAGFGFRLASGGAPSPRLRTPPMVIVLITSSAVVTTHRAEAARTPWSEHARLPDKPRGRGGLALISRQHEDVDRHRHCRAGVAEPLADHVYRPAGEQTGVRVAEVVQPDSRDLAACRRTPGRLAWRAAAPLRRVSTTPPFTSTSSPSGTQA